MALEDLYIGGNPRTVLSVGHARGAVLAACGSAGLSAAGYPPAEVKSSVCGFGRADKLQVQRMVGAMLAIDLSGDPDHATDALARRHLPRRAVGRRPAAAGGRPVIASLRGTVLERRAGQVVLDVGGVGYLLQTTSSAARMSVPTARRSRWSPTCTCARTR